MPSQKEYFIVSKIVGHRETDQGEVEYRVNWSGYPSSADTWEPEKNLKNCEEYIQQYIMSSLRGKKPRRSARLAQASSEEDIIEEVEEIVAPISRTQRARQHTKIKSWQNFSSSPAPEPKVKSYALRSGSSHKHITGGEQGAEATLPLLTPSKPKPEPEPTEPSQRMADISKRRPVSSTPFTRGSRREMESPASSTPFTRGSRRETTTPVSSTPFTRGSRREMATPVTSTPFTSGSRREMASPKMSSDDVLGLRETTSPSGPNAPMSDACTLGQADSSDDVMEGEEEEVEREGEREVAQPVKPPEQNKSRQSRWNFCPDLELGWKEVALTLFLSGVGTLGYICYFNDVCTYC